ncbi:MAG: hypothetical protein ABIQ81_09040 [Novosphingobium sp.]
MTDDGSPRSDPAKLRYFTIQAVRLAGVVMVLLGMLVLNGKLAWPAPVGYFLLLNGLFDALFVPTLLARRWKTPK